MAVWVLEHIVSLHREVFYCERLPSIVIPQNLIGELTILILKQE